jgi:hypothetical protein
MKKSFCLKIIAMLSFILLGANAENTDTKKNVQTGNWIKVPWSNGGYYWHNTVTREDRDTQPTDL